MNRRLGHFIKTKTGSWRGRTLVRIVEGISTQADEIFFKGYWGNWDVREMKEDNQLAEDCGKTMETQNLAHRKKSGAETSPDGSAKLLFQDTVRFRFLECCKHRGKRHQVWRKVLVSARGQVGTSLSTSCTLKHRPAAFEKFGAL